MVAVVVAVGVGVGVVVGVAVAVVVLTVGSLFSGIGGIDLGLERAGMRVIWQIENDPFCNRVLMKHWPEVQRYGDIQTVRGADLVTPSILAGGFPCQDVSDAGLGVGINGSRSGLWSEFSRLVGELRPKYILVENVPGLLVRGMGQVLGDLAGMGYDAEWAVVPAAAFGAHHLRSRLWILAYANAKRCLSWQLFAPWQTADEEFGGSRQWPAEPKMARVAYGLSGSVDRRAALGNAVVPQIVEWIGRRIIEEDRRITDGTE